MGQFKFTECDIEGMFLVEPAVFGVILWRLIMRMILRMQVMI